MITEVAPGQLSYFLMRTQETTVGEKATQEQIFIERFDVFEDSMNVVEGLVERWLLLQFLCLIDRRFKANRPHN